MARNFCSHTRASTASGSSGWERPSDHLSIEPAASACPPARVRRQRDRSGLFSEGEDLVEAALAAGFQPVHLLLDAERPLGAPAVSSSSLASSQKSLALGHRRGRSACFAMTIFRGSMHRTSPPVGLALESCRPRQHRHANPGGRTRAGVHRAVRRLRRSDRAKALRASSGAVFRVPTAEFDEAPGRRVALVAHGGKPLHELDLGEGTTRARRGASSPIP